MRTAWSNGSRLDCVVLLKIVKGGKFEIVGGTKDKPFVCWSNANRDWSEPKPTKLRLTEPPFGERAPPEAVGERSAASHRSTSEVYRGKSLPQGAAASGEVDGG
ncbi:hypothetical protein FRAHR75_1990003 [Frankia sp. Hr75.2]|nr:hypothetical protein FRAHR75_1990003 [Frankia sp. Hr75.2]